MLSTTKKNSKDRGSMLEERGWIMLLTVL